LADDVRRPRQFKVGNAHWPIEIDAH
jgi:hypothetical protein